MPAAGSHGDVAAGQFVLSGIASNSVRLRRQGDPQDMDRGRILKLGEQVVWSPKVGVTVRLVSIAHDEQSAVIEVDGDARQVRLAIGGDGAEGLKPGSKIRVERAPEIPEKP